MIDEGTNSNSIIFTSRRLGMSWNLYFPCLHSLIVNVYVSQWGMRISLSLSLFSVAQVNQNIFCLSIRLSCRVKIWAEMTWPCSSWNDMVLAPGLMLRFDNAKILRDNMTNNQHAFPFDCADYVDCSSDFSWRPTIRPTTCSSNRSFSAKPQANGRPISRPTTCLSNRSFTAMIFKAHHGRHRKRSNASSKP